jgi:hypothetical protein
MPDTLRLADGSYMRRTDVTHIVQLLYGLQARPARKFCRSTSTATTCLH